jgi:hypothetical protein
MIEPLPQFFSICAIARPNAFDLSSLSLTVGTAILSVLSLSLNPWRGMLDPVRKRAEKPPEASPE